MSNSPTLSVIVPCYNQAQFLPEALASVQAQTYQDWECIIINDGSPDNTADVAQEWVKKDLRFRYIEKPNGGISSARNEAISAARGELVLPLDADDLIAPSFLDKAVEFFHKDGVKRVVACQVEFFGVISGIWKPKVADIEQLVHFNDIVASSVYRKSLWQELGGYDENMKLGMEDWDFWLRAAAAGAVFEIIPEPLFKYRRRESSMIIDAFARRPHIVEYLLHKNAVIFQKHYAAAVLRREHEIAELQSELKRTRDSFLLCRDYRFGHAILAPIRWLKWKVLKRFIG